MRVLVSLTLLVAASFGDLDFNSNTRNFSFELLYHAQANSAVDVMVSPYTIWTFLVSVALETLGSTREQMAQVFSLTEERSEVVRQFINLRTSVIENKGATIKLRNFLFYDEDLHVRSGSVERLENDFRFITRRLQFAQPQRAADEAQRTFKEHGISLNTLTRPEDFVDSTMIMCNYFTFQAKWANPFHDVGRVHTADVNNVDVAVPVMYVRARLAFGDFDSLKASVTELPYEGGQYCTLLIRPHDGYHVKQVYTNLRKISLKDILVTLQSDDQFGFTEVKLPMFRALTHVNLNRPLSNMGLVDVFDKDDANFDHFADDKIFISEIAHKVVISITMNTTAVFSTTPFFKNPENKILWKKVTLDEPFIFFIMERSTATILFGGACSEVYVRS